MVLAELATYLQAYGGIGTQATDLFYGLMPEAPDAVVALFEYPGLPNEPELGGDTVRLEFPRVQVVVRGAPQDYTTPRAKINKVVEAFTKIKGNDLTGVRYNAVLALQAPFQMGGQDANFRFEFACNFQIYKGPSAT